MDQALRELLRVQRATDERLIEAIFGDLSWPGDNRAALHLPEHAGTEQPKAPDTPQA